MHNCTSLTNIDLSNLTRVQSIGNYFMNNCEGLISIDLSNLKRVQSIGNNFMIRRKKNPIRIKCSKIIKKQIIGEYNNIFLFTPLESE